MKKRKRIGTVAITLRLQGDLHEKLERQASIQGWSLQYTIARLLFHGAPLNPENVHDARIIKADLHDWADARALETARIRAAAIIAEAKAKIRNAVDSTATSGRYDAP